MYQYSEVQIKQMITDEYNRVINLAIQKYPAFARFSVPRLVFFDKGSTAGWAKYNVWEVHINTVFPRQNWAMGCDTISHEIAHMVAFAVYARNMGHKKEWKAIHAALGGNSKRCYNAAEEGVTVVRARQTKQFQYVLDSGREVWVNTPTHNKMMRGNIRTMNDTKEIIRAAHYTHKYKMKA